MVSRCTHGMHLLRAPSTGEPARAGAAKKLDVQRALVVGHQSEPEAGAHVEAMASTMGIWRAIASRGITVTRLCPAPDLQTAAKLRALSGGPLVVEAAPLSPQTPPVLARFRDLPDLIERSRPEVVHVVGEAWQFGVAAAVKAARRAGVPCGVHFAENGPALRGAQGALRQSRARTVIRHADYAVGWSRAAARIALRRWGYRGKLVHFPSIGVPAPFFDLPRPHPAHVRTVLFVGRLVEEKGVCDVLALAPRLRRHGISTIVVGAGPMRADVVEAANKGDLVYLGELRRAELPEIFGSADLTVVPSRPGRTRGPGGIRIPFEEQFGRVIVESLATGTPVVAYRTGEIPEALGPGGLAVPPGDVEGLELAICRIIADDDLWQRASRRGRSWAARFSDEKLAANLVRLWNEA